MFSIDTSGKHFQVLHSYTGGQSDGAGPHGSLYLGGSTLYGMTSYDGAGNAGTIFQYNLCSKHYHTIYSFAGPTSDGLDGLDNVFILNGKIYGMTKTGDSIPTPGSSKKKPTYDNGVIFSIPLASSS